MLSFEFPNLSIRFLLVELKPYFENAILNKIQEINSELFKFRIHSAKGNINLIVSPKAFFSSSFLFPARIQSSAFGAFLNKYLQRKKILSVEQFSLERVIVMRFSDFNLYFEFFGNGNIIFTDKENIILRPLKTESWASRQLKANEKYLLPPLRGLNPFDLTVDSLKKVLLESNEDLIRALVKAINLAPIFIEQALLDASIDKSLKASALNEKQITAVFDSIKALISRKPEKAYIVQFVNKKILVPFKVSFPIIKEFDSLNEALDETFYESFFKEKKSEEKLIEKKVSDLEWKLENLLKALNSVKEEAEKNKKKAELLYSNFQLLEKIIFRLNELKEKRLPEQEIVKSLKEEFSCIKTIDFRRKELVIDLA